jgi:hypothetical protein
MLINPSLSSLNFVWYLATIGVEFLQPLYKPRFQSMEQYESNPNFWMFFFKLGKEM